MLKNTEFIDKLRSSGLRPTKQRLKICEVLFIYYEIDLRSFSSSKFGRRIRIRILLKLKPSRNSQIIEKSIVYDSSIIIDEIR